MRKKCALIVDDSRTAREMLAKRLAAYDIDIVKVESAVNAIDYLYSNTPDAVFMDYEMPGMDGFQALRVIKSNPNTATIPVMMYTSKEGGLALGEARALGAIGVLPKQMGALDLDAVVEQLHLLPEQVSLVETFHDQGELYQAGVQLGYPQQPTTNVEYLNGSKLKHERVEYPGDVYDESVFVLKRQTRIFQKDLLAAEQRLTNLFSQEFTKLREDFFTAEMRFQELSSPARWKLGISLFGNLSAVVLIVVLWWKMEGIDLSPQISGLSADFRTEISDLKHSLAILETGLESSQSLHHSDQTDTSVAASFPSRHAAIEFLQWAANRGTEFQYGENPYDDLRIVWLSELVQRLTQAGFQGVINLQAHYGNFCLTKGETGTLNLARDQLPFGECLFSGKMEDKGFTQSSYQTIGFANFINSLTTEEGGSVEVFVEGDAQDDPIVPYPETYSVKTAGEWNRVAAQNQRIEVSLFHKTGI